MITAVDSNVLFGLLVGTAGEKSMCRAALARAAQDGGVVACVVVYAELSAHFARQSELDNFLQSSGCTVSEIDASSAHLAGRYFRQYRDRGGSRTRVLPDFLIAAHAQLQADRILAMDRRFFGSQFTGLQAVVPADLA